MERRTLLFTFDHELFLGHRSGTVERCMIEPAERVLRILHRYGLRAIFFVDTTWLMRLEEAAAIHFKAKRDLLRIGLHLGDLLRMGHSVYPHIHPHWLDARYDAESNEWHLDQLDKYRFADISEAERTQVFEGSMDILSRMLRKASPRFRIEGYRAGGWCIQPFSDFKPYFERYGIRYDLSVLAGIRRWTNALKYDFTAPLPSMVYRFDDDVMRPDPAGHFVEVAISSIGGDREGPFHWLMDKLLWRIPHGRKLGDGEGVAFVEDPVSENDARGNARRMMSVELLTLATMGSYLGHIERRRMVQFISHPKMFSSHNLMMLEALLRRISARYRIDSDWKPYVEELLGNGAIMHEGALQAS